MQRIRVLNLLVVAAGLLFVGSGCASVATCGGRDQKVTILSDTPGATVIVDGQPSGTAPATVSMARKTEHSVEIVAPGYEPAHATIRRRLNPWVVGNLLIGGPIGLIIDVVTDSTHTLSPDQLKVTLKPLPGAATPTGPATVQPASLQSPVSRPPGS